MMGRLHSIILLSFLFVGVAAVPASAQSKNDQEFKAYGSRLGDRDQNPNTRTTGNRRIDSRINSRLDSRLATRLDRFVVPRTDEKSTYTPKIDDGTKTDR